MRNGKRLTINGLRLARKLPEAWLAPLLAFQNWLQPDLLKTEERVVLFATPQNHHRFAGQVGMG